MTAPLPIKMQFDVVCSAGYCMPAAPPPPPFAWARTSIAEITTRSQQSVSQLGCWLTTPFGAIATGFFASSIATWYYADTLAAVLGWTVVVTLATALVISSLLRWRLKSWKDALMYELLAVSNSRATRLTFSLHTLASHGGFDSTTRDGWRVAFYRGEDAALFREPAAAGASALVRFLESNGPSTNLAVSHIRHATQESIRLANTQPFVRELLPAAQP